MDRDDARFVADALASRIAGDRGELERLAASSLMQISTLATRIKQIGGDWPPAIVAAAELMAICRYGGGLCDQDPPILLQQFVDSMRKVAEEPPRAVPRNRAERRAQTKQLPRAARVQGRRVSVPGMFP